MKSFIFIFITIFTGVVTANASPSCHQLKGQWVNEQGSLLTFETTDKDSGKLTGNYRSSTGTEGNSYPLIGWFNHSPPKKGKDNVVSISFSVRWGKHGSITSWTGTCKNIEGKPRISAIWNLVRSNSDYAWDHMITNQITFSPAN